MEIKEELTLEDIDKLIFQEEELVLSQNLKEQISESYEFLKEFISVPLKSGRIKY